ncbi:hypothetical protein [Joostella sp.]|uniref:hypothetical protein n=1 Tax=Joostella sp. TaxID=2231138 RepID=UPI003A8E4156
MKLLPYFLFLFLNVIYSQTNINEVVVLESDSEKSFLIAAQEGDVVSFNIKKIKGKKIADFTFSSLNDSNTVFSEDNFKSLKRSMAISEKSIYKLSFDNDSNKELTFSVQVNIDSQGKKPATIAYRTVYDTTYGPEKTELKEVSKLTTETIQKEQFYLNSKSNKLVKGGKDRVVFPVYLPENTREWFYVLTADRDKEAINKTVGTFSLASELSKYLDTEVSSISSAVTNLQAPPGAHICDVYLLNKEQAMLFRNNEDFTFSLDGTRENYKSGIIQVKEVPKEKYFIGIKNPDNLYGIHIGIEVVAIVETTETIPVLIKTPEIHTQKVPYVE